MLLPVRFEKQRRGAESKRKHSVTTISASLADSAFCGESGATLRPLSLPLGPARSRELRRHSSSSQQLRLPIDRAIMATAERVTPPRTAPGNREQHHSVVRSCRRLRLVRRAALRHAVGRAHAPLRSSRVGDSLSFPFARGTPPHRAATDEQSRPTASRLPNGKDAFPCSSRTLITRPLQDSP